MKKWMYGLLVVIIGYSLWLRFDDLYADLPLNLTNSAGGFFDGFDNSHAARSYTLFGELRPDGWDPILYSPPFVYLQILWFKVFPPSLSSINRFSAFYSTLAMFMGIVLFRRFGLKGLCLAALFLGLFYPWVHFSKVAMFENIMVFFMALSMLCLGWTRLTPVRAAGVGAFAILAYASKATAIYFLPTAAIAVLLACWQGYGRQGEWKQGGKVLAGYGAGSLAALIPWLVLFRIPDAEKIAFYGKQWKALALPKSLEQVFDNFMRLHPFHYTSAFDYSYTLGCVIAVGAVLLLLFRPSRVPPLVLMWSLWLGGGLLLASILHYAPARYLIPTFLPALCLAAYGLSIWTPPRFGQQHVRVVLAGLFCLHFLANSLYHHVWAYRHAGYTIENFSKKVIATLPPDAVIGGVSALFAVVQTGHRCVRVDPRRRAWYNQDDPFGTYGITHLVLTDYLGNDRQTRARYPKETSNLIYIASYHVCRYTFHLYEVGPPLEGTEAP